MMELCHELQSSWEPASTWRVVSLGNGYFSLQFSSFRDCTRISGMASSPLKNGTMRVISTWTQEYEAYKDRTTGPSITLVRWLPPPPSWIKVNTDGSFRGRPVRSSCGGVFRNCRGEVVGCFTQKLGLGSALEAELSACILALDIARHRQWNKIWLESDSTDVVELLASRSMDVPENVKDSWTRALGHLTHMEFRVSHIYREGNRVADALADADAAETGWWPHVIPEISELVHDDAVGCFNTRTRV